MSASDELRALEEDADYNTASDILFFALPELIAVVREAEDVVLSFAAHAYSGHPHEPSRPLLNALRVLDQKLVGYGASDIFEAEDWSI